MAPSAASDSPTTPDNAERNLQPFFVLHKASLRSSDRKSAGKTSTKARTRRRIDLTPTSEQSEAAFAGEHYDDHLRTETFNRIWSKIESTIKDVLRNINAAVFNDICCWVQESFHAIRSCGMPDRAKATPSYPIVMDPLSKQLCTGLVFTKNMEFVDDLLTFEDLGLHLRSHGCHVANLSSFDFSVKNGIAGCLRGLLRQFLMVGLDVADMSILASWYIEQGNYDNPMVVIIDDMERCCGSVLTDFILMLSEWVVKIPIILIIGVATTVDALRSILPSNALKYLSSRKFVLGSPAERMDAIIEAVLVKQCSGFSVGHKVAIFLRNYFIRQDGTLTSFVRALKIAIVQHISMEPLSFILGGLFNEHSQDLLSEGLPKMFFKRAFDLPSCRRLQKLWSSVLMSGCLYEAGKSRKIPMLDLYCEALDPDLHHSRASDPHLGLEIDVRMSSSDHHVHGRLHNCGFIPQVIRMVRDLSAVPLCQLLNSWEKHTEGIVEKPRTCTLPILRYFNFDTTLDHQLSQNFKLLRNRPNNVYHLIKLFNNITNPKALKHSQKYNGNITPKLSSKKWGFFIHVKVRELQSLLKFEEDRGLKQDSTDISRRQKTRRYLNIEKDAKALNEKAAALINCMVKNYMMPIESIPFHEIICFKSVDKLQAALIGDPRRTIQVDLLEFQKFLKCSCCSKSGNIPFPSMHDTSIMYILAQEHGDLINLHDWYQSFKTTVLHPRIKGKHRSKQSPSPKKRKDANESQNKSEAFVHTGAQNPFLKFIGLEGAMLLNCVNVPNGPLEILDLILYRARFCRAVTELQITGLLRMPSKRRPDYVQRVAFGL
ncbi:unnamed protein product [Camellia sinensis]